MLRWNVDAEVFKNIAEIQTLAGKEAAEACLVQLEGSVIWSSPEQDQFIMQDDSGAILVHHDTRARSLPLGQRVRIAGNAWLIHSALHGALIVNDGLHALTEKSVSVTLAAGRYPIRVDWFNGPGDAELDLLFEGPGVERGKLPDSAFFRADTDPATGKTNWVQGLNYSAYEGDWKRLPDFGQLSPLRTGTASNLDLGTRTRDEGAALQFQGFLDVQQAGIFVFRLRSDDGSRMFLGAPPLELSVLDGQRLPTPARVVPGQSLAPSHDRTWSSVEGTITFANQRPGALLLELTSETGSIQLRLPPLERTEQYLNRRFRATGVVRATFTPDGRPVAGELEVPGMQHLEPLDAAPVKSKGSAPILTRIAEIKNLDNDELRKGLPARIRGVVTHFSGDSLFLQDGESSIYVRFGELRFAEPLRLSDYWEIEGQTFVEFAPSVQAAVGRRLGPGTMPEPLRPTWDQIMNGTLDTRYIELKGVIISTEGFSMEVLTHAGKIKVTSDLDPGVSKLNENAVIRLRGCAIPGRDEATFQVRSGRLWLCSASLTVDQPPPPDLFDTPMKRAADLRRFDPQASALNRVKVAGQFLHANDGQYFVREDAGGFRVEPRSSGPLEPGDTIEAVGYPDLTGPSPLLREALVRHTGKAALPAPHSLDDDTLLDRRHDAIRVSIQALLTDVASDQTGQTFSLLKGRQAFSARLHSTNGPHVRALPGSLVRITGVFSGKSADPISSNDISAFELLLNSAADVVIIEQPSWWTLRRLLTALAIVAGVLVAAMLWALTLKRQVNVQTRIIHEKVEREATMEERARIAREIHDTLEQALAGTSLQLDALAGSLPNAGPGPKQILEMARSMVRHAQEEARRTVRNLRLLALERNDLPSALAQVTNPASNGGAPKIEITVEGTRRPLPSQVENHLLRIGQEATTNALRHARAENIRLHLHYAPQAVELSVMDDGCGFDAAHALPTEAGHFGLLGMRERAEKMGGSLQITSAPGKGTSIRVVALLSPRAASEP
jgi:signal transduction histidine kinase